ncbi:MAG: hypothetical protein ACI4I3_04795 [Acutalibacteraceae bacterium]
MLQQKLHVPQAHFIPSFLFRRPQRSVGIWSVFTDSRKGCPYDLFFQFVVDDAYIVHSQCEKLFAHGELVRRGRRTLRNFREFVIFQAATVGDGSPVPHRKHIAPTDFREFLRFPAGEHSSPLTVLPMISAVFPERRGRRSLLKNRYISTNTT